MSWTKVKLGQFLINREGRYKPNDPRINGLKRIEKIDFSGKIYLSDKPSNTDMILVKKGDLVISGINVEKGAMNIYEGDEAVVATIHYSSYQFDKDKIEIDFLKHYLKSLEFKKALKEQVPGGIKTELKPKHILPLIVEFPLDLNDQRRVIEKLDNSNLKVNEIALEISNQLSLIKQLRQAFLREAMQGKLVPQDPNDEPASVLLEKIKAEKELLIKENKIKKEKPLPPISEEEIPFEIPENWVWCRLNEICLAIIDCPHSTPKYIETETEYYGIDTNCINDKGEIIRLRGLSMQSYLERVKRLIPKENDIVYAREGSIGRATFIPRNQNVCLGQRVMLFRPALAISHLFLMYAVTEEVYKKRLLSKHRGMGAKHVNVGDIVESLISLPPLTQQQRIVSKLDELMKFCDGLEESIKESQGLNDKLLQEVLREALSGEKNNKL